MHKRQRQFGFSLLETMLAAGILGVGLVLIAMIFPVGIKLTGLATERTLGAIAADEALAKIQLYGFPDLSLWATEPDPDPDNPESIDYLTLLQMKYGLGLDGEVLNRNWSEFLYPSNETQGDRQHYHWSALCRALNPNQVQVTVFVTRKAGQATRYYGWHRQTNTITENNDWPSPVPVNVDVVDTRQLRLVSTDDSELLSNDATIVTDHDGRIYRVLEFNASNGIRDTLVLNDDWQPFPESESQTIWVVPPGVGSSRNPVVTVRQAVLPTQPQP